MIAPLKKIQAKKKSIIFLKLNRSGYIKSKYSGL